MCIVNLSRFGIVCAILNILIGNLQADQPRLYLPLDDGYNSRCVQGVNGSRSHQGTTTKYDLDLDTSNFKDENVRAAIDGIAYVHLDSNNFGNHVNIDIGHHHFVLTGHMKKILIENGQYVYTGQIIGKEGCTGICDGDHIHFGLHTGDPSKNAIYSESVPMERVVAIDTADNILREYRSEDFICPGITTGHIYKTVNKELKAGLFQDGWHTDGISQAFLDTYNSYQMSDGHNPLGFPGANGPEIYLDPYVFEYGSGSGIYVQQFYQPDSSKSRFKDGITWLAFNPSDHRVYVIALPFLNEYAGVNGYSVYGAPLNKEYIDTEIGNSIGDPGKIYVRQDFSLGKTMLLGDVIRIVDTPAGTVKISGASGGSDPLTLTGWSLSKTQVYLTWSGGIGVDGNSYYAVFQNGSEVAQVALLEATLANLTSGQIYRYKVAVYDRTYGILEESNEISIVLPSADAFILSAQLDGTNAVLISLMNDRFSVVGGYGVYRNGQEIARTSGDSFSDFDLAYNTEYVYQAAALSEGHLVLGWTNEIRVKTGSAPHNNPDPTPVPAPKNPNIPLAIVDMGFVESPPYVTDGFANAFMVVKNIGISSVAVRRFMMIGYFTHSGEDKVYVRNWKAVEFPEGLSLNSGDTYRYQMNNDGQAFPGIAMHGVLKGYTAVKDIVGQYEITQAMEGKSAEFHFEVEQKPLPPHKADLHPVILSIPSLFDSDSAVLMELRFENNGTKYSPVHAIDILVDGVLFASPAGPELNGHRFQNITFSLGRMSSGIHTVTVLQDSRQEVDELNENNNVAEATLEIFEAPRAELQAEWTNYTLRANLLRAEKGQ